jgi:hypothetical protein
MGVYVAFAKPGVANLPKVIVVSEPVRELDPRTNTMVIKKQGLKVPRDGGVTYPVSKVDVEIIKNSKTLSAMVKVLWLEHLDANAPAKVVNAAIGKDIDQETRKMSKPEIEKDTKEEREKEKSPEK